MAEARRITGLSREWISRQAQAGKIPGAIKRDARTAPWYFTESGLRQYIGEDVA